MPLRVSAQDTTEFEFHISPVSELVATPDRRRDLFENIEHPSGADE